jgi:hypothetical protein
MIAQISEKIVTFVCIFRENRKKTRIDKRRKQEDTEVVTGKFLAFNPTLALTHEWGGNWCA